MTANQMLDMNDAPISIAEFNTVLPNGIPVDLLMKVQDASGPKEARRLVNDYLASPAAPDDPATTVYGRMLWKHMDAARKDFDGPERKSIYETIERFRELFPAECQVWEDRYSGPSS